MTLAIVGDDLPLLVRWLAMLAGVALVAIGSGFYLGAHLGPGPRDGLMTGLHRVTGQARRRDADCRRDRGADGGWLLGGTVGIGTLLFAVSIGPAVALALRHMSAVPAHEL